MYGPAFVTVSTNLVFAVDNCYGTVILTLKRHLRSVEPFGIILKNSIVYWIV